MLLASALVWQDVSDLADVAFVVGVQNCMYDTSLMVSTREGERRVHFLHLICESFFGTLRKTTTRNLALSFHPAQQSLQG